RAAGQAGLGQAGLGDRADLLDHRRERGAEQVARGDPHHRPPPKAPQAVDRPKPAGVAPELGPQRRALPRGEVGQAGELVGVGDEEVGGGRREAEQAHRSRQDVLAHQQLARRRSLADPGDRHAGELRVGRLRERSAKPLGRDHPSIMPPRRRRPARLAKAESTTNATAATTARKPPPRRALRNAPRCPAMRTWKTRTTSRNVAYPPSTVAATCRRRPRRSAPSPGRGRGAGRRSQAIAAARKTAYEHTSGTTIRRRITAAAGGRTPTRE